MRLGIVDFLRPSEMPAGRTLDRVAGFARAVEAKGFAGLWVTDAFGRGSPTLDPLTVLAALASICPRLELGTCVLQVPLRHPAELAHRLATLEALSGGRLRLGVGSGSTKTEFDLVGADYEARFKTLMSALATMRQAWRGEAIAGGTLSPWPGTDKGPQIMLGAWRNPRWIAYAAEHCQGWIASGINGDWADLERGMRLYRAAGGGRAILANVIVDLHGRPDPSGLAQRAKVSLACPADEVPSRLHRIRELGFDDVLLGSPTAGSPDAALADLERVRDLL
jgi:alkanesulfonate monooxygenase SsuD/methylene tetrahydromethanopterin reductase-like flavin-dependent oxidoreductase (luciferase family)